MNPFPSTNPLGSKPFSFNGLDWQAVKRTAYRGIGGVILALIPQLVSPDIHYTLTLAGHVIDYSVLVVVFGAAIVRAVEAWITDNSQ